MKKLTLFLIAISLIVVSPALGGHAIPTSGDYLKYCQESIKVLEGSPADKSAASSCIGYVEASIGMHEVFNASGQGNPFYCIPENGLSTFDAISIWIKYLENNPQKLNNSPAITFILAISEAYLCS